MIDDDEIISNLLAKSLKHDGIFVNNLFSLKAAKDHLASDAGRLFNYSLVILDLNLPDGSGYDLLAELKLNIPHLPVLIISSNDSENDRVKGLDRGAEDYICKPFSLKELQARVRVILRRGEKSSVGPNIFKRGELEINFDLREVTIAGSPVKLTATEFDILKYFVRHGDTIVERSDLFRAVWGGAYIENGSLDPHISRLRKKMAAIGPLIETVSGIGFKLII